MTIQSHTESGHATNVFPSYVYCETKVSHGWLPRLILHRPGCGAFGVVSGLTRHRELNDTIVRVLCDRHDGRVLGETAAGIQIALKLENVSIMDVTEDCEVIEKNGRVALRFAHLDKYGCGNSFALLQLIHQTSLHLIMKANL